MPPNQEDRGWWLFLREFVKKQQLLVFIGVVIYVLLLAMKVPAPFGIIMVSILSVGNTVGPLMTASQSVYLNRPFPWNWLLFLPILLASSLLNAVLSVALVKWISLDKGSFAAMFRELAPLVVVVCVTVGIILQLNSQRQRRLNERNMQLERDVERGTVRLQQQEQELDRAREIQQSLLPASLPQIPGLDLAGAWYPARSVSGDYFDVIQLDEHRLGLCIADVSGKGITAALLMANLQAAFRVFATPENSPADVCAKLNTFLCGSVASGKFITFFYAVFNIPRQTLEYENAGHLPGVILRGSGAIESLRGHGAVLGLLPDWRYANTNAELKNGDRLLLFTDGITEAADLQGEEFGEDRLIKAASQEGVTAAHLKNTIMEQVRSFCSSRFHDDATLMIAIVK